MTKNVLEEKERIKKMKEKRDKDDVGVMQAVCLTDAGLRQRRQQWRSRR